MHDKTPAQDPMADAVGARLQRPVRPAAWIDSSGYPHHLSHVQGVSERRLYGPLQPLYDKAGLDAEREGHMIALREWAVARWRAEVQDRPLENKSRRPLDDTWRQVMRFAGLDPDEAVGPSHDALLAARRA